MKNVHRHLFFQSQKQICEFIYLLLPKSMEKINMIIQIENDIQSYLYNISISISEAH